jgi:hypothetical protein
MSVNDASWIVINNSRVTLQIAASLTDNSSGVNYDRNMFIVQVTDYQTGTNVTKLFLKVCLGWDNNFVIYWFSTTLPLSNSGSSTYISTFLNDKQRQGILTEGKGSVQLTS